MSFQFDASKAQAAPNAPANVPTTTAAVPFTFEVSGGGDARKPVPAAFPAMMNTAYTKAVQPSQVLPTGTSNTIHPTGYGFGTSATAAPPAGMVLGSLATPAQASGLSFGVVTTQSTGIGFGTASATPTTGFTAALGSTTGFSLGTTTVTTTAAATTAWSFDASKSATSTGFALGGGETIPAAPTGAAMTFGTPGGMASGFHLGNTAGTLSSTVGTTAAVTTFSLGSNTAATTVLPSTPTAALTLASITTATTTTITTMPSTTATTTAIATTSGPGLTLDATKTSGAQPGMDVGNRFSFGPGSGAATTTVFGLNKTSAVTVSSSNLTSTTTPSLGTTTTVTSSTSGAQLGAINFCQLEESINKWTLELEEQEKVFVNQATQINAWDKLLIANGEKIVTLNQEVERVKIEQQQLEHELDYVVGQQKELQDCLEPLEKELVSLSVSDPEREYTYRLAENLDTQLKQMSEDLKEIIEHLNEANRTQDSSDPIVQIGKILNAHMNSLQWLDQRTALLSQKIQQIDQMHQNFRQENERSFSLAYT